MAHIIGSTDGVKYTVSPCMKMDEANFRRQYRHLVPSNRPLNFKLWAPCMVQQGNGEFQMQLVRRDRIKGEIAKPLFEESDVIAVMKDIESREQKNLNTAKRETAAVIERLGIQASPAVTEALLTDAVRVAKGAKKTVKVTVRKSRKTADNNG
jgi:hypothetical protein